MDMVDTHNLVNDYIKTKLTNRKAELQKILDDLNTTTTARAIITIRIDEVDVLLKNVFRCDYMEIKKPEQKPERSNKTDTATNYIVQANAPMSPERMQQLRKAADLAEFYNDCAEDATWD